MPWTEKPFVLDELLARVQRLAKRSRPIARTVVAGLTRRELEILRLLACGMDHVEIAHDLVIAAKTVEKHIEHILLKLGVHSRAQAIALALQQATEITPPPAEITITRLEDVKTRGRERLGSARRRRRGQRRWRRRGRR